MKFKEYRMLIIIIMLLLVIVGLSGYFIAIHNTKKLIIASVLILATSLLLLSRYNMKLFHNSMIVYEFKIIGILPIYINYKEVKDVKLISKHKVLVEHTHKTTLYITNGVLFYQELTTKLDKFRKDNK